jgi:hypothetical protein
MALYDSYTYAGLTIQLHYDDSVFNPRDQFDHAGTLLSFTGDFTGDKNMSLDNDLQIDCLQCSGLGTEDERYWLQRLQGFNWILIGAGSLKSMESELDNVQQRDSTATFNVELAPCHVCNGEGTISATVSEWIKESYDGALVVPLRYADYGSDCDMFDVEADDDDINAAIYCTAETIQNEWNGDRNAARACLEAEVSEFSAWLKGEVYGYVLLDEHGNDLPEPFQDSCWGFIGDDKYVRDEAERAAAYVATRITAEAQECEAMAARGIVTIAA